MTLLNETSYPFLHIPHLLSFESKSGSTFIAVEFQNFRKGRDLCRHVETNQLNIEKG